MINQFTLHFPCFSKEKLTNKKLLPFLDNKHTQYVGKTIFLNQNGFMKLFLNGINLKVMKQSDFTSMILLPSVFFAVLEKMYKHPPINDDSKSF